MDNVFRTPDDYELFIYTLTEKFPSIIRSTVTFSRIGSTVARVSGELYLKDDIRIVIRELVLFDRLPIVVDSYGYEVWRREEKKYWYDSQPHPDDPLLKSSHPHHKHIHPDIKHNRIPAHEMSFNRPNIPVLIQEADP